MDIEQYSGDGIPDRLRKQTVEDMLPEKPYVIDAEVEVYIVAGRLAADKRCFVEPLEEVTLFMSNPVILMRFCIRDAEGNLCDGVVADCRFYRGGFGVDDEEIDNQIISAVIDYGENGEAKVWGDPNFFDAAMHMVKIVDNGLHWKWMTRILKKYRLIARVALERLNQKEGQ